MDDGKLGPKTYSNNIPCYLSHVIRWLLPLTLVPSFYLSYFYKHAISFCLASSMRFFIMSHTPYRCMTRDLQITHHPTTNDRMINEFSQFHRLPSFSLLLISQLFDFFVSYKTSLYFIRRSYGRD